MQSLVAFLAVLVGAAVAHPMVLSPDDKNKDISSAEYLKEIFQRDLVAFDAELSGHDDLLAMMSEFGLTKAVDLAERVNLKQILKDDRLVFGNQEATPDVKSFEYDQSLNITSPNYPESYPNNANAHWLVSGPADGQIVAVFTSFDLEYGYDVLVIGSGLDPNDISSLLVMLTGSNLPDDVIADSSEMWLVFTSNDVVSLQGFRIEISVYIPTNDSDHGDTIYPGPEDHDGPSILSPNFPESYPLDTIFNWLVSGPADYQLMAVFRSFEIEEGYDTLQIGSGLNPNDTSSVLVTLTGSELPGVVVSNSSEMWLVFTSDSVVSMQGFDIDIVIANLGNLTENETSLLYDLIDIRNYSLSPNFSADTIDPDSNSVQCYEELCSYDEKTIVCRCDKMCRFFGDCCPDYTTQPSSNETLQNGTLVNETGPDLSVWECIEDTFLPLFYPLLGHGYRMIARCPSDWILDNDVKRRCEGLPDVNRTEDVVYVQGDTYYRNVDCAICNGLEESLLTSIVIAADEECWWTYNGTLGCDLLQSDVLQYNISTNTNRSTIKVHDVPIPRICLLNAMENCPNGTEDWEADKCRYHYMPFLDTEGIAQKHPACSPCNGGPTIECGHADPIGPAPVIPDLKGVLDLFVMPIEEFQVVGMERPPPYMPCKLTGQSQCSAISSDWPTCESSHTIITPEYGSSNCLEDMLCFRQITMGNLTFSVQVPSPCLNQSSSNLLKDNMIYTWLYTESITPSLERMRGDILQKFPTRDQCKESVISVTKFCFVNNPVIVTGHCDQEEFLGLYSDFTPSRIKNETLMFTNGTYIRPAWWSIKTSIEFSNANMSSDYEFIVCGTEVALQTCSTFTVSNDSIEWFDLDNQSVILHEGHMYGTEDFILNPDGSINICLTDLGKYSGERMIIIIGHILFAISSICLLATFITYVAFPTLRNRQGVSIMNFITALFIGQILLQYVRLLVSHSPTPCLVVGALSHYFFLASFVWTTILAWDLSRSFAANNMKSFSTSTFGRKMVGFLAIGWGTPLLVVVITLAVQLGGFSSDPALQYSSRICWLGRLASLTMFFGPVTLCLLSNLILFIITIHGVHSTKKTSAMLKRRQESQMKQWMAELKIYAKISGILGFAWVFGFLAMVVSVPFTEYIFLIAICLQGIFIFLSFGANTRVRKLWRTSLEGSTVWTQFSQRYSKSHTTVKSA